MTTPTWRRSTRPGAASPTAATSTAARRRGHAGQLPPHEGGRQEHRHPRARHRRLRRLLPVPRRHGRDRARADRRRAAAYVGDSTSPDQVRTRTLQEETNRVFRSRVVNPRWITAMQRHGYKGAFELAATVDYLFGFDATTGWCTTGCTPSSRSPTCSTRPTRPSCGPPTRGRCAASSRSCTRRSTRAVDRARPGAAGRDAAGLPRPRGRPRGPVSRTIRWSDGHGPRPPDAGGDPRARGLVVRRGGAQAPRRRRAGPPAGGARSGSPAGGSPWSRCPTRRATGPRRTTAARSPTGTPPARRRGARRSAPATATRRSWWG